MRDDELTISVLDRTFEHGLGLFETFRTWNGHPTMLDRHLERLQRSAGELGLPLDPADLPDPTAVADLLRANGVEGDAMVRITLSGGRSEKGESIVWMRSAPLPPPVREGGAIVVPSTFRVVPDDPLARHKTLNYWARRLAYETALRAGADEALILGWHEWVQGLALEGSRTNLFIVIDGRLVTLSLEAPILPGVMRGLVLERARRLGLDVLEIAWQPFQAGGVPGEWLETGTAEEVFLTNSVRGIVPVGRAYGFDYPAPGPSTRYLQDDILPWLERGGVEQ